MSQYDMELESKDNTFSKSSTIPETQSLLDIPSPYSTGPSFGNTMEAHQKDVTVIDDFPEGGTKAWAAVAGSFIMVFLTQGAIYSFGVYQDYYTRIFLNEHSPSKIAWIGSIQLFLIFVFGLPIGKLFDDGYFYHLVWTGSAIYVFSYFMLSLAKPHHYYQVILSQGIGVGIGMSFLYVPSLTLAFHYFKRRRGLALGLSSTGAAVGAIIQTIGLNHLINGKVGFAWGVRIFGFIFLILVIIGNLLMRTRLPPRKLRPGNQPKPNVEKIVKDIPLLLGVLASCLFFFSAFFPYFYFQLFAILHGISTNLALYSLTIMNAATILGRVVSGLLADRYGYINAILVSTVLLGSVTFVMIRATTVHGLIVFTILYGFFSGAYFALAASSISVYVDNPNEMGFALGYTLFIESFFVLIAQPVFGAIVDAPHYRWNRAIITVSLILYAGVALLFISRLMLWKQRRTWKL